MNCCCDSGETNELKIEGDVGADPIWCSRCGCNLDLEEVPISERLTEELLSWATKYGEWIDWNKDILLPNGMELEDEFNQIGVSLTKGVKQEIGGRYHIKFIPSTSAKSYANRKSGFR
ncbi:hypothetical protein ACIQVU_16895 [Lysinibacillus sp. NPDC098008]|uniref:hypothetical protein n=1 Tax=Lysinibacillus sp. NPDC098008 TaxID=3364146 RepID=UPI0037FBC736